MSEDKPLHVDTNLPGSSMSSATIPSVVRLLGGDGPHSSDECRSTASPLTTSSLREYVTFGSPNASSDIGDPNLEDGEIRSGKKGKRPAGKCGRPPMSERQQLALLKRLDPITVDSPTGGSSPTQSPATEKRRLSRVHRKNDRGETPLHIAARKGEHHKCLSLIKAGAVVNDKDHAGWTPLHEACNHKNYRAAKTLVLSGADVNALGLDGDTPLHDAASSGDAKLVALLLRHGADATLRNASNKVPIEVVDDEDTAIKELLENGVSEREEGEDMGDSSDSSIVNSSVHSPTAKDSPSRSSSITIDDLSIEKRFSNQPSALVMEKLDETKSSTSAALEDVTPQPEHLTPPAKDTLESKRNVSQEESTNEEEHVKENEFLHEESGLPMTPETNTASATATDQTEEMTKSIEIDTNSDIQNGMEGIAESQHQENIEDEDIEENESTSKNLQKKESDLDISDGKVYVNCAESNDNGDMQAISLKCRSLSPSSGLETNLVTPKRKKSSAKQPATTGKDKKSTFLYTRMARTFEQSGDSLALGAKDDVFDFHDSDSELTGKDIVMSLSNPTSPTTNIKATEPTICIPTERQPQTDAACSESRSEDACKSNFDESYLPEDRKSSEFLTTNKRQLLECNVSISSKETLLSEEQAKNIMQIRQREFAAADNDVQSEPGGNAPIRLSLRKDPETGSLKAEKIGPKKRPKLSNLSVGASSTIKKEDITAQHESESESCLKKPGAKEKDTVSDVQASPAQKPKSHNRGRGRGSNLRGRAAALAAQQEQQAAQVPHWSSRIETVNTVALSKKNSIEARRSLKEKLKERWKETLRQQELATYPKLSKYYEEFITRTHNYHTHANTPRTTLDIDESLPECLRQLYARLNAERQNLKHNHMVERERLMMTAERSIERAHLHHLPKKLSAVKIIRDQEIYNPLELDTPDLLSPNSEPLHRLAFGYPIPIDKAVERNLNRFNSLKEDLIRRHQAEVDGLHAGQIVQWQAALRQNKLLEDTGPAAEVHLISMRIPKVPCEKEWNVTGVSDDMIIESVQSIKQEREKLSSSIIAKSPEMVSLPCPSAVSNADGVILAPAQRFGNTAK